MREKRNGRETGKRSPMASLEEQLCADTAVLRGERGACVYGCHRILHYAPERICLCIGKRRVCIKGAELLCTAFNAGCVTVEGRVDGILYCRGSCEGDCPGEEREA